LIIADRAVTRVTILFVVLGFMGLLVGGVMAGLVVMESQRRTAWVDHTYDVEREISGARLQMERMEATRRGYLLDPQESFRQRFAQAQTQLRGVIVRIRALTADNRVQQANVARFADQTQRLSALLAGAMDARTPGGVARARATFATDGTVPLARQAMATGEAMLTEENRLLDRRLARQNDIVAAFYLILAVCGLLLIVLAAASTFLLLRYVRALARSRDDLRALNEGLEEAVSARTRELQRANDEIQRFAYIVSHDLRSPLVNVLGFTAELEEAGKSVRGLLERLEGQAPSLVTAEARRAIVEDYPEALGFIRTSTEKMDRLINAILKLSREGRRTVVPEPLDMDALVRGLVDSIRHLLDEKGTELTVRSPLPRLVSDRLAVEQILSNLIENAVKYLEPRRPGRIEVRGRRDGDRVVFEVEDNGRGIDPKDHERVFELFRRAGTQDQPGEGIGLAHVRALAYRLGGTVTCVSALDAGAVFSLSLPATAIAEMSS
jgi:signal transduction histidine kinase